jgi:hypothetical protein
MVIFTHGGHSICQRQDRMSLSFPKDRSAARSFQCRANNCHANGSGTCFASHLKHGKDWLSTPIGMSAKSDRQNLRESPLLREFRILHTEMPISPIIVCSIESTHGTIVSTVTVPAPPFHSD